MHETDEPKFPTKPDLHVVGVPLASKARKLLHRRYKHYTPIPIAAVELPLKTHLYGGMHEADEPKLPTTPDVHAVGVPLASKARKLLHPGVPQAATYWGWGE